MASRCQKLKDKKDKWSQSSRTWLQVVDLIQTRQEVTIHYCKLWGSLFLHVEDRACIVWLKNTALGGQHGMN